MIRRCFLMLLAAGAIALAGCAPEVADVQSWDQGRKVLVFGTADCYYCQRDKPLVEKMRARLAGEGVEVIEIDGDEHPELARQFGVDRYPTYVVCEDGEVRGFTTNIKRLFTIIKIIFFIAMFFA